jgi:hypothetical protein
VRAIQHQRIFGEMELSLYSLRAGEPCGPEYGEDTTQFDLPGARPDVHILVAPHTLALRVWIAPLW